jgi:WD40 repeat protein
MGSAAFFCKNSQLVFTQSADWSCKLRDLFTGDVVSKALPKFGYVGLIRNCKKDNPLLLITDTETSYVYDFVNNTIMFHLDILIPFADDAALSPNGNFLAVSNSNGTIEVIDTKNGKAVLSIEGERYELNNFEFSPDSQNFIAAFQFGDTQIYNLKTLKKIHAIDISTVCNNPPAISPNGKIAAIPCWDYTIKLIEIESGMQVHNLKSDSLFIDCAVFSPDGKKIISSIGDLWDTETGNHILSLDSVDGDLRRISFNVEGSKIIAICAQAVKIWDSKTGHQLFKFCDHSGYISNTEFSFDGNLVLSSATDGYYVIRDAGTGNKLYTSLQLNDGDWLAFDENYRFDGTENARDYLYFVCGYEVIDLNQLKDALYVPGLIEKKIKSQDINYPKISDLEIVERCR